MKEKVLYIISTVILIVFLWIQFADADWFDPSGATGDITPDSVDADSVTTDTLTVNNESTLTGNVDMGAGLTAAGNINAVDITASGALSGATFTATGDSFLRDLYLGALRSAWLIQDGATIQLGDSTGDVELLPGPGADVHVGGTGKLVMDGEGIVIPDDKSVQLGTTAPAYLGNLSQTTKSNTIAGFVTPTSGMFALITALNSTRDSQIANKADPTMIVSAATDWAGDTTARCEWTHDRTDGRITCYKGNIILDPPTNSSVIVSTLEGVDYFRPSGSTSDIDIISILTGATVTRKCFYDHSQLRIQCTSHLRIEGNIAADDVMTATDVRVTGHLGTSADTLLIEVDQDGGSGANIAVDVRDDTTVVLSIDQDGTTVVLTGDQGDLELIAKAGSDIVMGSTVIFEEQLDLNGAATATVTGAELETVTHHHGQQGGGYFDFTGACADGETITIDSKTFEFDDVDGASCTGGADYCVDVSGGANAAQCATALVADINGASENFSSDLETDIAMVVGHTVGDNLTLAETGGNITVSAANLAGDETAQKHIMHHFDYTVTSADETAFAGASGAITIGAIESAILPNLIGWHVFDSAGEPVSIGNVSVALENTSGNHYSVTIRDGGGGRDLDAGDILTAHFVAHE